MKKAIFIIIGVFSLIYFSLIYFTESEFGITSNHQLGQYESLIRYFDDTSLKMVQIQELDNGAKAVFLLDSGNGKKSPWLWEHLIIITDSNNKICAITGVYYPNSFGGCNTVVSRFLNKYWDIMSENVKPKFVAIIIEDAPRKLPPIHVAKFANNGVECEWTKVPTGGETILMTTGEGKKYLKNLNESEKNNEGKQKFRRKGSHRIPLV